MEKPTYQNIKTVLIADDDEDLRDVLQEAINDLGFVSVAVPNGAAAFEKLKAGGFDLLLTDFRMPVMDGVELMEKCRQNNIHIPVIFFSTNADLVSKEQVALSDCCATLMFKPLHRRVLLAALSAADQRSHHKDCIHSRTGPA